MFGQTATPMPAELGLWILCAGGFMGMYWIGRQIWVSHFPMKKQADEYVTHEQFDTLRSELKTEVTTMRTELTAAISRIETGAKSEFKEIQGRVETAQKELYEYIRESVHDQRDWQQSIVGKLGVIEGRLTANSGGVIQHG